MEGLESANVIVIYFDPKTKAPVSLLEMGLFAFDAVGATSPKMQMKQLQESGKKKAAAVIEAVKKAEELAKARAESISTEIHQKIEDRATDIFGKK